MVAGCTYALTQTRGFNRCQQGTYSVLVGLCVHVYGCLTCGPQGDKCSHSALLRCPSDGVPHHGHYPCSDMHLSLFSAQPGAITLQPAHGLAAVVLIWVQKCMSSTTSIVVGGLHTTMQNAAPNHPVSQSASTSGV